MKNEVFIVKANKIHNHIYNYELVEYINNKTPIIIICLEHGKYNQTPSVHLDNSGCPKCGINKRIIKNTSNIENFIIKANIIHKNKYSYNLTLYKKAIKKVTIVCPEHGEFKQTPNSHLLGRGCPECGKKMKWTNYNKILLKFIEVHGEKYKYDELSYCGRTNNMNIFCKKHNFWFSQSPHSHMKGYGCPNCNNSLGEKIIKKWLEMKNIKYVRNKTFKNCKNIKQLPFDFFLPKKNILIEYDGEQHYKPKNFGGISKERAQIKYLNQVKRDKIKNKYANENNIELLRISYLDDIKNILNNTIS